MILVKKGRYSLRNTKENVETAANWVTSHHSAGPRWSKMTRMKLFAIIVRSQVITRLTASNYRERIKKVVVTMLEQEMGLQDLQRMSY